VFRFICILILLAMVACQQSEKPQNKQAKASAPETVEADTAVDKPAAVPMSAVKPAAPKDVPKQAAQPANSVAKEQMVALKPAAPEKLAELSVPEAEKVATAPGGDAARGAKLARGKCGGCHYFDRERKKVGPGLQGIYGRAPSIDGIPFARWDAQALDTWLTRPKAVKPKTRMSFRGLAKKQDRDDVIAYLKTL